MVNLLTRTLLIVTLATVPLHTLVLRDGSRIHIDGALTVRDGQVVFRQAGGALYSIALSEVDQEATRSASRPVVVVAPPEEQKKPRLTDLASPRLNDKQRLIHELEGNHSGVAASPEAEQAARSSSEVDVTSRGGEWEWRQRARQYREPLLRAQEDLQFLVDREQQLRDKILTLSSLGYRQSQFTYDTSELVRVREQIDHARVEVTRAQRALDQFLDDARKQGALPGWLR